MMPNSDPRDRFVCPYLTLMIDSFSCTLFLCQRLNTPHIHVSHFVLTSFSDAFVTFVSDQVTRRPLQPMFSTASEHQGQNSISDPDQNLRFTCIFSSGMQEPLVLRGLTILATSFHLFQAWYHGNIPVQK